MAICFSVSGLSYSCQTNIGGIKSAYITNFENVQSYTANTEGTIVGITMSAGSQFHEFQFNSNTGSITEELASDRINGTSFFTTTTNLVFNRREAAKRDKLLVLTNAQPRLVCIVKDSNNLYWIQGLDEGAYVVSNTTGSGVQKADANNYQIAIESQQAEMVPEVDSAVVAGII